MIFNLISKIIVLLGSKTTPSGGKNGLDKKNKSKCLYARHIQDYYVYGYFFIISVKSKKDIKFIVIYPGSHPLKKYWTKNVQNVPNSPHTMQDFLYKR